MPALPLFAYLRRYVLAVVEAAELAADIALAIQSKQPAGDDNDAPTPYDTVPFERGMATVLPDGYEIGGFKPEQPTTGHGEFVRITLTEIARCLNIPYCVAAGDSSKYNYASGRLDHQTYLKSIEVDRGRIESAILDRIFDHWLREYLSAKSGISPDDIDTSLYAHQWFWTGREHVDPVKEANAQATRLENHTTTLAYEYARQGRDWESELRQRAKEVALMNTLGLPLAAATASKSVEENEDEEENEDAEETASAKR
jgi:capsid protein